MAGIDAWVLAVSAASTTWKKLASSAMLPSRFHWSPAREISSSRETFCSTIHFWSVVSSLKVKRFPFDWRTRHSFIFSSGLWPPIGDRDCAGVAGGWAEGWGADGGAASDAAGTA